jgi:D-serine deaminase-like pyridoxal phosphate-dependent protein
LQNLLLWAVCRAWGKERDAGVEMTEQAFPGKRICPDCPGLEFKGLEDHAGHLQTHNPSPAQWYEANKRIEAAKERSKKQEPK